VLVPQEDQSVNACAFSDRRVGGVLFGFGLSFVDGFVDGFVEGFVDALPVGKFMG